MAVPAQVPPPAADFATMNLGQIQAAVAPGEPETMTTAGAAFDAVSKYLKDLSVDLNKAALDLAGGNGPWTGEGATAFATFANALATNIGGNGLTIQPYQAAMDDSAKALTDVKAEIARLVKEFQDKVEEFQAQVAANPPGTLYGTGNLTPADAIRALEEQYAVLARQQLTDLAQWYGGSGLSMHPVDPGAANPTPVEPGADEDTPDENPEDANDPDDAEPQTETGDPNAEAPEEPDNGDPLGGRPNLTDDAPVPPDETAAGLTGGTLGNPGGPPPPNLTAPDALDGNLTPPAVGDPRLVNDDLPGDPTTKFTGGAPPPSVGNPGVPAPPSLTVPNGPTSGGGPLPGSGLLPGGGPLLSRGPLLGPTVPNRSLPTGPNTPGPNLNGPAGSLTGPNPTSPNSAGGLAAGPDGGPGRIGAPGVLDGAPRILGEGPAPGGPGRIGGLGSHGGIPPMMGGMGMGMGGAGTGGGERERNAYRNSTPSSSVIGRYYTTPHGAYEDEDERLEEQETWLVEEDETVWEGNEKVVPDQHTTADRPGTVAARTADRGTTINQPAEVGTTREATA